LWYVLVLGFAVAAAAAFMVQVPDVVSGRFTLAPHDSAGGRLQGVMRVPESGVSLIAPGQAVRLRLDAFPYQRFGVRTGVVRSAAAPVDSRGGAAGFVAVVDLDHSDFMIEGRGRAVLPGMGGRADVVIGRRSLLAYLMGSAWE
jgi:membrane fusion protein